MGVVRRPGLPSGRDAYADTESGPGKGVECVEFVFGEWQSIVEAARHRGGRPNGIGLVQHRVCDRDGQLANRVTLHHVAEVDQAGDLGCARPHVAHHDVMLVGVAVDHSLPEVGQQREGVPLERRQDISDQVPTGRIKHGAHVPTHHLRSARQIPIVAAPARSGVGKSGERPIHCAQIPAKPLEECVGMRARVCQRPAR